MKIHHHHRGLAGMFVAASLLYYFGLTSHQSSAAGLDCNTASSINVPVQECIGLMDLYNNMNGPTWYINTSWDTDVNVCSWYGVSCTNILGQDHVTDLSLNNNHLSGTNLPASMSGLTYISGINLSTNTIKSALPPEWSAWTNIRSFLAGNAQITGSLPTEWSDWGDTIQVFGMTLNELHGTLPSTWDTRTSVESFSVYDNNLTGTLPSTWSTWTSIKDFDTSVNTIQGQLPATWSSWNNIENFAVPANNITGNLPTTWSARNSIKNLSLRNNQLHGSLPSEWSTFSNIEIFYISNNQLIGTLPTAWSTRTNIKEFAIGFNQLTGSLPSEWSTRNNIESFSIFGNYLNGALPASWSAWSSIKIMDLSLNNIAAPLPPQWGTLNTMENFTMHGNGVIGELPSSWSGWTNIKYFHVGQNQITGTLPSSWSTWTGIIDFNVNSNQIGGNIPASWSAWTNINRISLPNNLLEGEIPASWTALTTLYNATGLILQNNCLETDLPEPPASFVEAKAGTAWESSQNLCDVESNLIITKSNSLLTTGQINGTYTYTIDYINSGDNAVSGVVIHDILMTGFSYDSAIPAATLITGQEISWDIGTLNSMEGSTITIVVSIGNGFSSGDTASNTATIEGILTDIDTLNNTSTTMPITIIGLPVTGDLAIEKTALDTSATAGETIAYTLEYSNQQFTSGNAPSAFSISDTLPTGLTYVSTDFGSLYDFSTGIEIIDRDITWNLWDIDSDSTGLITIYAQIDGDVTSGTLLSNTASITGSIEDSNWTNNISTADDILVFGAVFTGDLAVFKSSSHTGAYSGDIVTFTIVYVNSGENLVTGISLLDIMSPDLMYLTSSLAPDIITGDVAYTSFYWYLASGLAAHSSGTITMQAQVMTGTSGGSLRNTVQIESPFPTDIDSDNDISNVDFTFLVASDISGDSFSTPPNDDETRSYAGPGGWDIPRITYQGIEGANNSTTSTGTGIVELGAPTLLDEETCMYKDGDFTKFKTTFKDIQNSVFKPAVDMMLDYCLVQGEYNQGKMFGVYNYLKWGEAYKIFGRLAGVDFSKKSKPMHWSDTYRFAGMKLNLWASTTSQPHNPKSYISYADIFTIGNNILKYYKKSPLEYDPTLNYNNAISRGKFALFISNLITAIKQ